MPPRSSAPDSSDSLARAVRREYEGVAGRYDRRWARYVDRSLAVLRPWVEGAALGDVLDVGTGTGALFPRLRAWGASARVCVGLDPSPAMLRRAVARVGDAPSAAMAPVAGAAEALPFADGSFDTVVSTSALHYWTDAGGALREVRRVLRPGGRVLLLDWSRDFWSMRLLDGAMRLAGVRYARMYTLRELRTGLEAAGLSVARERTARAGGMWGMMAVEALASGRGG
ncbi:MAG TPA: class I SAM-dependent methyltransferase [Longimicrobium sp.]|nr:class I SAM-dependent methyltransferase [Longimicrobium sp.]